MDPAIPLERFADLSAELDAGAHRDDVLARAGLSAEIWASTQEIWLGRIAADAARKRFELTRRYTAAFVARRRALAAAAETAPRPRAGSVAPAAEPAVDPVDRSAAPDAARPAVDVAAPPPEPLAPPPFTRSPSAPPSSPAFVAPAPALSVASPLPEAACVEPEPAQPAAAARLRLDQTIAAISPFASGAPMPFRSAPAGAPARSGLPKLARTSGLPFRETGDASPAGAPHSSSPPDAAAAEPGRARTMTVTLTLEPSALDALPGGLPFQARDASPPAATPPPAPDALPFRTAAPAIASPNASPGSGPGGGLPFAPRVATPAAVPSSGSPPVAPAPAPAGASAATPRLPLARFAQMSAETELWPAALPAIRARYGLDEAAHAAEREAWQRLFAIDRDLYARYGTLFVRYRDWLASSSR